MQNHVIFFLLQQPGIGNSYRGRSYLPLSPSIPDAQFLHRKNFHQPLLGSKRPIRHIADCILSTVHKHFRALALTMLSPARYKGLSIDSRCPSKREIPAVLFPFSDTQHKSDLQNPSSASDTHTPRIQRQPQGML